MIHRTKTRLSAVSRADPYDLPFMANHETGIRARAQNRKLVALGMGHYKRTPMSLLPISDDKSSFAMSERDLRAVTGGQ